MSRPGGLSEVFEADGKVELICEMMSREVEARTGKNYDMFKPEMYRKQIVNGTNYFIKVYVGGDDHLHLSVYQKLPREGGTLELTEIQQGKSHHDPIEMKNMKNLTELRSGVVKMPLPGEYTEVAKADGEIQKICDAMKSKVEAKTGKNYHVFKAKLYRKQIVSGTNYLIKVKVGEEEYIHLLIFQNLPCNGGKLELTGIQEGKRPDDPLVPF